jgi:hypothetical protein
MSSAALQADTSRASPAQRQEPAVASPSAAGSILALDVATRTGVAIWSEGKVIATHFQPSAKEIGPMLAEYRQFLRGLIVVHDVITVAKEAPFQSQKGDQNNAQVLRAAKLHGVIEELCATMNVPLVEVHLSTWRTHFLGKISPPKGLSYPQRKAWWKEQALRRCAERGWEPGSHDAAEACGVLDWYMSIADPAWGASSGSLFDATRTGAAA